MQLRVGLSAYSNMNFKLGIGYLSSLHRVRLLVLTNVRSVSVYVTTLHYLVTDSLQLVMSDRGKVQVGFTFSHASGFSFPVAPVELSTYSNLSPFLYEPL